jgi:hypothetical protein
MIRILDHVELEKIWFKKFSTYAVFLITEKCEIIITIVLG